MLNEMRFGELSAASIAKFKNTSHDRTYEDGVEPTELCVLPASHPSRARTDSPPPPASRAARTSSARTRRASPRSQERQ